jgi:hypothetical protein
MLTSPGGTKTYSAPTGSYSSRAKRKLVGADIIPSSMISTKNDEACANVIKENADLKRKYRNAVNRIEATEKDSAVTYMSQLQELVHVRNGESEMMIQMLKGTPLKDVPIFKRSGIQNRRGFCKLRTACGG